MFVESKTPRPLRATLHKPLERGDVDAASPGSSWSRRARIGQKPCSSAAGSRRRVFICSAMEV